MLSRFLIYFLLAVLPLGAWAQESELKFARLSLEHGLSQNSITCILRDHRGYLWIGTHDGLNRYDGYQFKIFKNETGNPNSLGNNHINCLYEDRQGVLWVGTFGGGLNRYEPDQEQFTVYKREAGQTRGLSENRVLAITEDPAGNLWVGTNAGLNRFDRKTRQFFVFRKEPDQEHSLIDDDIRSLWAESNGSLWVGTSGGLCRMDARTKEFTRFPTQAGQPKPEKVYALCQDLQGNLWIGTFGNGLYRYQSATGQLIHYRHDERQTGSLSDDLILSLTLDANGTLWVGTFGGGLNRYDAATDRFSHYTYDPLTRTSLSSNSVSFLYWDRKASTLWAGTGSGISSYSPHTQKFTAYTHDPRNPHGLPHKNVFAIYEDKENYLWIGTFGGGLIRMDRSSGKSVVYRHNPGQAGSLSDNNVWSIYEDKAGFLWIATSKGLNRLDRKTGQFTIFRNKAGDPGSLHNDFVWSILEDRTGIFWLGTSDGLSRFDRSTGQFTAYLSNPNDSTSLSSEYVSYLIEDREGVLWVATSDGLNRFDRETGKFKVFRNHPGSPGSLSNNYVSSLYEDQSGVIWVATSGGLNRYDRKTQTFAHYNQKDGLPNNEVYGILEDEQHRLWLSTNLGLSRFDPRTLQFRNYDVSDGLQSNEFNEHAFYKSRQGELFFGGINGFNAFYPERIQDNPYLPPVVFTDFQIFNQSVPLQSALPAESNAFALPKPISEMSEIVLPFKNNFFSFEFAALNFTLSQKNQYAYRMDGLETDWVRAGTRRFVTYTNLEPGEYTFMAKAANNDGVWNDQYTSLRIIVLPPWWRTWWAYLLYSVLIMATLYGLRHYTIARERLKNDLKLERLESEKLHELDGIKTRFFTNISHEFRTPLTLILGPLEKRLTRAADQHPDRKEDQLIYRNAQRLLQLINQLLDISKLESGTARLEVVQGDVVQYLRTIVHSFSSLAETRRIQLLFESGEAFLKVYFDKDKLEKIISNLLSNAFKFTPEGGEISVKISKISNELHSEGWVEVVVQDSGIGIPADQVNRIFDRFYQIDGSHTREQEGTGIGLALTKELIALHKGEISVSSELGKGTCFTFRLPLGSAHLNPEEIVHLTGEDPDPIRQNLQRILLTEDEMTAKEPANTAYEHLPLILIVEDNHDVRQYIRENFQAGYRIAEATDGQAGLDRAIETVPDLIISDLMMPKMDGIELCRRVKTDERISHVPVILLTARTTSKLEGLETGADDYLTKPFSPQELQVRVKNLIEQRQKLRARFSREVKLQPKDVAITSADEKFLERAVAAVEKHMSDSDFSVETFESEMAMSKMQLYRKLKALTDQSPNEFVRHIRLKKAAMLLRQRSGNVAEITYEVGFNNLSYFARCFKEVYGVTPSEYANQPEQV
jgi:ligand-binding sensor domain-containing protein/signal transduction histidine kinase/DNA-binding response OmpR family regulator